MTGDRKLAEDVAAASASLLYNVVLPAIRDLPPSEQYDRLAEHIADAIGAYTEAARGWHEARAPEPSIN